MRLPLRLALPALLALCLPLVACQKDADQTAGKPAPAAPAKAATPEAAVQQLVALIKAGDFRGFWKAALPTADYATLRADWTRPRPDQKPITDQDRANFAANLKKLTEPDAETKLYAELKPKLVQGQQQYKDQLPMMVGVLQAVAGSAVDQSPSLSAAQKQQLHQIIGVLAPWAQQAPWFDQDKAKQGVGIVVGAARQLDIKDADQLRTLDFDSSMQKYGTGFAALRKLLALYGLSIDDTLDSIKASVLEKNPGSARLKLDYTLQGKPLSTELGMVEQDGQWYDRDLLQDVRDAHQRLAQPAAAGSAPPPPGTAAAPAAAGSARPG